MKELYHKLMVTFFLLVLHVILQVGAKLCYITQSSGDKSKDGGADSILDLTISKTFIILHSTAETNISFVQIFIIISDIH